MSEPHWFTHSSPRLLGILQTLDSVHVFPLELECPTSCLKRVEVYLPFWNWIMTSTKLSLVGPLSPKSSSVGERTGLV